jgi:TolB-like protein/Flp pilus assembly protein TadD
VLPFANLSGDKDQEYFSDGLTEEILNTLARERDLRVPGRASAFSFKGKNVSSSEIAKALNVSRLVEGSVRKSGNKVRISVSLTRAADGFSEELGTFTEEMTDIFALQDKVARAVVEKLTRRAVASASVGLTKNPEAYDAYLKGRALQTRGAENRPAAIKCYEEAVRIDPAFALAWARLAEARFRSYGAQADRSPEVVDGTRVAIDRALAARPDLPEGLIMRANWVRAVEYDFVSAKRDLDRAESLQAATSDLRFAQAQLARDLGRYPEAFRLYRAAIELDPQNGDFTNAFAVGLCWPFGEIVEADRLFRVATAIQGLGVRVPSGNLIRLRLQWRGPEAALRLLERLPPSQAGLPERRAELLVVLGRVDEARVLLDSLESGAGTVTSIASMGGTVRPSLSLLQAVGRMDLARQRADRDVAEAKTELARGNRAPGVLMAMIRAQILLGQNDAALAALEEWRAESQRMPSDYRQMSEFMESAAGLYSLLGKTDEAVALLQQLRAKGNRRISIRYNQHFDPIRHDPRVQLIMREDDNWARSLPDPTDP